MDRRFFLASATAVGVAATLAGPARALVRPPAGPAARRVVLGMPGADAGPLGLLGGLPFGPGPEAMRAWLDTADGRELWHASFARAGLTARPLALEPAPGPALRPGRPSLPDIAGRCVAAPWPLRAVWLSLGAVPSVVGRPAEIVDPAPAPGHWRGFGPRCRIVAEVTPVTTAPALVSTGWTLPAPVEPAAPAPPERPLPAEIMVAAGAAWSRLRAGLLSRPDPLERRLAAALLTLPRVADDDLSALWPWGSDAAGP